jgi:lon-related putative ATP-dependent protease
MGAEVSVDRLRKICDPQILSFSTSDELSPGKAVIGQQRATRALQFGLGIRAPGFNIFVSGLPGTGRTTAVTRFLQESARGRPVPPDWCYVYNFRDPSRPNAISLPAGRAVQFKADMSALIESSLRLLRAAFESEEYAAKRAELDAARHKELDAIQARVNEIAQEKGFTIQQGPAGIMTIPLRGGHPVSPEEFMALSAAEKDDIAQREQALESEIDSAFRQVNRIKSKAGEGQLQLDRQVALYVLKHPFDDMMEKYQGLPEVLAHLEEVRDDIVAHLSQLRSDAEAAPPDDSQRSPAQGLPLYRYAVNVLVDATGLTGAPVVIELNPTYTNLFGRMENEAQFGTLTTNFTLITRGSLHQANGGYLVLPIDELLVNPLAWDSLKRALRSSQITIEDPMQRMGVLTTRTLQPEAIPLEIKVILIGRPAVFRALQAYDEDFDELFKVKADFDSQMARTPESMHEYAGFVSSLCAEEGLKHLDSAALARLIEHGSRLAEDQAKLSTRFGDLADVVREANFYADQEDAAYVSATHVRRAIAEKFSRSNLVQQRLQEMTARGMLMIDVHGQRTGQVNGLAVLSAGEVEFGHPNRITASVGIGREGVIDLERESKLGGPLHTKGVLILAGYLMGNYAHDQPLSISARLVFEQSYSGVEGDSASSAELYALLSELAGLPVKQAIAVTGSVNQKGEVQAIGGANEKIEGFFAVCRAAGLSGEQGVIIPQSNVDNLMLQDEVVEAARANQFHVWGVSTIDEGIEILTGVPAGARLAGGEYPEDSVNGRVERRLRELAGRLAELGRAGEAPEKTPAP